MLFSLVYISLFKNQPSRTTYKSSTLIDHIISNSPTRISHTDVLPCPLVSYTMLLFVLAPILKSRDLRQDTKRTLMN